MDIPIARGGVLPYAEYEHEMLLSKAKRFGHFRYKMLFGVSAFQSAAVVREIHAEGIVWVSV